MLGFSLGTHQRKRVRVALALSIIPTFSSAVSSQEGNPDPRVWPLSSIGRVNVITGAGSRFHCTGTLIGPRHVLTAAHCLFNNVRGVWVHPSSVHFVAGYARGEYKAHSRAIAYVKGEGFAFTVPLQPASATQDWAGIELAVPIGLKPVRVKPEVEASISSADIMRAGYRGDRSHVLTVQRGCSVKAVSQPAGLLLHSCSWAPGESGSALVSFSGGEPWIVGILTAGSKQEGASAAIAVPSSTFAAAVENVVGPKL